MITIGAAATAEGRKRADVDLRSTMDNPKHKRRDPAQPTDIAERMIAFQRKNAQ